MMKNKKQVMEKPEDDPEIVIETLPKVIQMLYENPEKYTNTVKSSQELLDDYKEYVSKYNITKANDKAYFRNFKMIINDCCTKQKGIHVYKFPRNLNRKRIIRYCNEYYENNNKET